MNKIIITNTTANEIEDKTLAQLSINGQQNTQIHV